MTSALLPVFDRVDLAFESGEGCWLKATNGRRFLDFGAGIAVTSLGHQHPVLTHAIVHQAQRVLHVSNLYRVPEAEDLANKLVAHSFADTVFFCNSGTEANEGLVKMVRRYQAANGHPERNRILCFDGAFHGRTLAMLSATGNPKYLEGFGPAAEGFDHVTFDNLNALRAAITNETAAVLIEPIQGESGVKPTSAGFLKAVRDACDEFGLLLALDEVQTGMGRTGKMFAYEWEGVTPDVMSVAKGLGGGFPIGAVLATARVANAMTLGSHGTTFGGNPLACAAGIAVIDTIGQRDFLKHVTTTGEQFGKLLTDLCNAQPEIFELARGRGLMWGLKCRVPVSDVLAAARAEGLLCTAAGDNILRLVPPLIVTSDECRFATEALTKAARRLTQVSPESTL